MRIVAEPEGKCAILWILGEYGLLIEDAPYLLEPMIDGFTEEVSGSVRLEMLTATVKLFFCRPPEMQGMLGRLLEKAIQEVTHPDVRDRALLYYRLLEHSPEEARRVICAPKEVVEEFQEEMDAEQRDKIFEEFNTLSIVYKQPAAKFVVNKAATAIMAKMQPPPAPGETFEDDFGAGSMNGQDYSQQPQAPPPQAQEPPSMLDSADLLGEGLDSSPAPAAAPAPPPAASSASDLLGMDDLLGGGALESSPLAPPAPPAAVPFALAQGAVMDGASFEARWAGLPALPQQSRPMRPASPLSPMTTSAVEEACRRVGICVIASGMIPPQAMKFFFSSRQVSGPPGTMPGETWFLTELTLVPGGAASAAVKAENAQPASVERYLATLWEALQAFVS